MTQIEKLNSDWEGEIEKHWRQSLPRFTDTLLAETFAESILDLDDKLLELKAQASELTKLILDVGRPYFGKTDRNSVLMQQFTKHWYVTDLVQLENNIHFIERLQRKVRKPEVKAANLFSDKDIEAARLISIVDVADLYVNKLKRQGKNYYGCCPFHADNSPSLVIYTDSNCFHCFGCHEHGDVIAFAQKVLNSDFKSTITYLLKR